MTKPNVIVFGASKAGENYLKNQTKYNVLAIADNDIQKQGRYIKGIKVIPPVQISDYQYDYIVIASMFIEGITKQLIESLSVGKEKIIYVPKRLLKIEECETFRDIETKKLAYKYLEKLSRFFVNNNYRYYLNFGTLLGVVRDGDLIPWDDDIDIAVLKNFDENLFLDKIKMTCHLDNVEVEYLVKRKPQLGLVGLDVVINTENTFPFTISVDLLIEDDDKYRLPIDIVPKHYFAKQQPLQLANIELFGPYPVEKYLTYVYKDWKVIKKDVTYENNTTTYDEPKDMILQKEE